VDWALLKLGISEVKAANRKWVGYGSSSPQKPLPQIKPTAIDGEIQDALQPVVDLEAQILAANL